MNKITGQQASSDQVKAQEEPGHRGAVLKRERESRGIDLDAVHEATKIPLDSLRAIEEDYKIRTMSEFYYNSFLKIYAKYLGIDVSSVVDQNKSVFRPKPAAQDKEINFDLLDKINKKLKLTKERKRQILLAVAAIVGLWLLIKFTGFIARSMPKPSPKVSAQASQRESGSVAPVQAVSERSAIPQEIVVIPQPASVPTVAAVESAASVVSGKSVVLSVRAKKESWLRVKVDGNIVFQSTLNAGGVETWDANDHIEITGRNLNELELELNGKLIALGRSSRGAKALLVTKDGLSVTK